MSFHWIPRALGAALLLIACTLVGASPAPYSPEYWQAQRHFGDVEILTLGDGAERAYIFKPANEHAHGLPLVLFHHGWLGMNPLNFGNLIDLMVRRGAVVVYAVYQDGDRTAPQDITRNAAQADRRAVALLEALHPGLVDTSKTLYWGFSMGATISLNLAVQPGHAGLPAPRALMLVSPGDAHHIARGERARSVIGPVEDMPANLPVIMVSGLADTAIGVPTVRKIAARLCHLPAAQRNLLLFPSDTDGQRKVSAGHGSPGAPDARYDFPDPRASVPTRIHAREDFEASGSLNQLDFHGYWRLSLGLLDYVAGGPYPEVLFSRNAPANLDLGSWPDGRPYAPAHTEDPCAR